MALEDQIDEFQKHIFETLDGDATLTTALSAGSGVVDHVPDNPKFPYIEIGDIVESEFRTFSTPGAELLASLHIYSSDKGYFEASILKGHCDRLLGDTREITLVDSCIIVIFRAGSNRLKENFEGSKIIRHVIPVYRALVQQLP